MTRKDFFPEADERLHAFLEMLRLGVRSAEVPNASVRYVIRAARASLASIEATINDKESTQ